MRFQVNKEAYGQPSFQKSTKDSHSESERPLTKSGKPDMRFKVKKEAYGQSSFQKSTKDSRSESERPLTKIGRPDVRFKVNKQAYGSHLSRRATAPDRLLVEVFLMDPVRGREMLLLLPRVH